MPDDKSDIDKMETEKVFIDPKGHDHGHDHHHDADQHHETHHQRKSLITGKVVIIAGILFVTVVCGVVYAAILYNRQLKAQAEIERRIEAEQKRQRRIGNALGFARKCYIQDKYQEAGKYLQQVFELDHDNPAAKRLEQEIAKALGQAKTVPLRDKAGAVWEKARKIDIGDGFGEDLVRLKKEFDSGEILFQKEDYDGAAKAFKQVIAVSNLLLEQDLARREIKEKIKECLAARVKAVKSNANNDAEVLYQKAQKLSDEAKKYMLKRDYDQALKFYNSAAETYALAFSYARDYRAVENYKKRYALIVKDAPDEKQFERFGGKRWKRVKSAYDKAVSEYQANNMSESRKQYAYVVKNLPGTIKATRKAMVLAAKRAAAKKAFGNAYAKAVKLEQASKGITKNDLKAYGFCQQALDQINEFAGTDHKAYLSKSDGEKLDNYQKSLNSYRKSLWNNEIAGLGMKFAYVLPGEFEMGSIKGESNEQPVHKVTIKNGFWIGVYEVTQAEYKLIMGTGPAYFRGAKLPVERINWNDAVAFCRKLTERERKAGRIKYGYEFRLPTESEWEFAARGGVKSRGTIYSGSSKVNAVAWYDANSDGKTHEVGSKAPNELGLYDMSGNVLELCLDEWHTQYDGAPVDGSCWFGKSTIRVCRGGSWYLFARDSRVSARFYFSLGFTCNYLGFRVVFGPVQKEK